MPDVLGPAIAATGAPLPDDIDQGLTELAGTADWAALVPGLRRILAGERDRATLTNGLDEIGTTIVTATLTRITPPAAGEGPPTLSA